MRKDSKTLISIGLLLVSIFVFYLLTRPINKPLEHTEIIGLKRIPLSHVRTALNTEEYDNQSLLNLKRSWIKEELMKNPLVESVKVQGLLLPVPKIRILIKEIPILAVLELEKERMIFDTKGRSYKIPLTKFTYIEEIFGIDAVPKIYASSQFFTKENLTNLSAVIRQIERAINRIGYPERIICIYFSANGNLKLKGTYFNYKIGELNKRTLSRVKRLDMAITKIQELLTQDKIDLKYIDLSLQTKEIILGKHK